MAKSKLLAPLETHQVLNSKVEKQQKLQRQPAKKSRAIAQMENIEAPLSTTPYTFEAESEGRQIDENQIAIVTSKTIENDSDSDSDSSIHGEDAAEGTEGTAENEDIRLSDVESLTSQEITDIFPHQRLTINNTATLTKVLKSIELPFNRPFSAHQSITTSEPVEISDVHDDLVRELAFYKQSLDAAHEARNRLNKEGVPFSRPTDYFAEMVKSDEHMGKIKSKLMNDAANKMAAADARKQRDLKKYGKQVQVAKLQERDKAKRETLDKINLLKRKWKDTDTRALKEEDLFNVGLEDASKSGLSSKFANSGNGRMRMQKKRQKRDGKHGFGGSKRFLKSSDAASTADLRAYSVKKMKGKKRPARLGKSRRAKT